MASAEPPLLSEKLCNELNEFVLDVQESTVNGILSATSVSDKALGGLLAVIVSRAKNLLQREHREDVLLDLEPGIATQLYKQQPELRDIVRKACEEKNFGHIVDLKFLQRSLSGFSSSSSMQGLDTDRKKDLIGSFDRPYIGKAVDGFFEYLSSNAEKFAGSERIYYGKFCSIVQSSGTGKSRLLTELRKKGVITLYMNIREKNDTSFPHRDEFPSRMLTENLTSEAGYATCCCAFFAAIFATLEEVLKEMLNSPGGITKWTDDMCNMDPESTYRADFFRKVESKYSIIYTKMTTEPYNQMEEGASAESSRQGKKRKSGPDAGDFQQSAPSADTGSLPLNCARLLRKIYAKMLLALPTIFTSDSGPKLVIGIDEAHSLSKKNGSFRPSHILCRVINAYSCSGKESVWVAFASTTSRVADFSAPQRIHESLRVTSAGMQLFPPYTYLGWDQNADAFKGFSANEVESFHHIAGFGRPLWRSLMDVGEETLDSIMATVTQKLLGSHGIGTEAKLALIALTQRFALDVCFGHPDAVSYIEDGVAGHLRICYTTLEDRTWSFTGYPSEPLVSCAAAHILHRKKGNLELALAALKDKVNDGLFEIGQSGELTSRLVLLLAKDSYVRRYKPRFSYTEPLGYNRWNAELIDCQKVSVVEFMESMFGISFWAKAGYAAETSFRYAYVNFSHWVSMDGLISPKSGDENRCSPTEWTLRHWHRTSAVQCCHHQPSVDKMIPIFFDGPELQLASDMERVSQMFVSDKAGQRSHEGQELFINRTERSIQCQSPRPWIALLFDFNGNGKTKLKVKFEQKSDVDQCLYIYASGLSEETFPFLPSNIADLLQELISKPKEPTSGTRLEARVKYGKTVDASHMKWEDQDVE